MFWIRNLRLGPVHLSLVRNVPLARLQRKPIGWFLTWDKRWVCGTIRVRSICFNLDADFR